MIHLLTCRKQPFSNKPKIIIFALFSIIKYVTIFSRFSTVNEVLELFNCSLELWPSCLNITPPLATHTYSVKYWMRELLKDGRLLSNIKLQRCSMPLQITSSISLTSILSLHHQHLFMSSPFLFCIKGVFFPQSAESCLFS